MAQPAGGVADFAGGVAQPSGASALQNHKDIGQTAGAEVEPVAHRAHRVGAVQMHTLAEIALGQRGQRIMQRLPVLVSDAHHDHAGNQRGQPAQRRQRPGRPLFGRPDRQHQGDGGQQQDKRCARRGRPAT